MATAPTLSSYKSEVIAGDVSGLIDNITDAQFVSLLNQALINKHEEIVRDCPSVGRGSSTLTFSSNSYSISLPSSVDPDETKEVTVFSESSRSEASIIPKYGFCRRFSGSLFFENEQPSGTSYYIEYTKEPNEYALTGLESQTFSEGINRRTKKYIAYEIRKLYYDGLQNNEPSSAGNKLRGDSNDIS